MWNGYMALFNNSNLFYVWPVRAGQHDSPDSNYPANIWKTGQAISYAPGDDGDLGKGVAWPVPRFVDNGNGTVIDNLTGIAWLKDANCIATKYPSFDNDWTSGDGGVTWQHALDFVAGINNGTFSDCSGGYDDWHLPNWKELRSLIDYSNYSSVLPSGHPFSSVQSDYYWSSTTVAIHTNSTWIVHMYNGYVGFDDTDFYSAHVWPVRGGTVTITDTDHLYQS